MSVTTVDRDGHIAHVDADEPLDSGDVVPGFSLHLRAVFDELTTMQTSER